MNDMADGNSVGKAGFDAVRQLARDGWRLAVRLIQEGNRRQLSLRTESGDNFASVPVTLAAVLTLLFAASGLLVVLIVAVIISLIARVRFVVETVA